MIQKALQYLFKNEFYFATFRVPNQNEIITFVETNKANQNEHFTLNSFNNEQEIKISGDFIAKKNEDYEAVMNLPFPTFRKKTEKLFIPTDTSDKEFKTYVSNIVDICKNTEIQKVVAARTITKAIPKHFNIIKLFLNLCNVYPSAFVSFSVSKAGVWIGATPEILITKTNQKFKTVSLAGTKKLNENRDWTPKEIEEQAIVTRYILSQIKNKAENILVGEAETIQAGKIAHLKTTISFNSNESTNQLAQLLHPTPAVCGLPKEKAFDIIAKNEGERRSFYSGFLGFKENDKEQYFVNLRCMQIIKNKAILYVGAGITKDSEPNKEWEETEAKAQTLGSFL